MVMVMMMVNLLNISFRLRLIWKHRLWYGLWSWLWSWFWFWFNLLLFIFIRGLDNLQKIFTFFLISTFLVFIRVDYLLIFVSICLFIFFNLPFGKIIGLLRLYQNIILYNLLDYRLLFLNLRRLLFLNLWRDLFLFLNSVWLKGSIGSILVVLAFFFIQFIYSGLSNLYRT